jgi:hypothetical protein
VSTSGGRHPPRRRLGVRVAGALCCGGEPRWTLRASCWPQLWNGRVRGWGRDPAIRNHATKPTRSTGLSCSPEENPWSQGAPSGTRTPNPLIKREQNSTSSGLYQHLCQHDQSHWACHASPVHLISCHESCHAPDHFLLVGGPVSRPRVDRVERLRVAVRGHRLGGGW